MKTTQKNCLKIVLDLAQWWIRQQILTAAIFEILQGYHSRVVLDASDKNRTGFKLWLYTDPLFTCSECPTETVRKCKTQFRNVSILSKKKKKENKSEACTQLLLVTPLYRWKLGNNVWELGDVCDFHTAFVWLSWLYMDRYLPTFWWLFLQLNKPLYFKVRLHHMTDTSDDIDNILSLL